MDTLQEKLIGELIGLARATDGNEHLITPSSTSVVIECLTAEHDFGSLMARVEEEKRKMVPNCFLCACPCGRNNAYDLAGLKNADDSVREWKEEILRLIRKLAASKPDRKKADQLYLGLIVIGMDELGPEELAGYAREIGKYVE